jgi:hypothetical protein
MKPGIKLGFALAVLVLLYVATVVFGLGKSGSSGETPAWMDSLGGLTAGLAPKLSLVRLRCNGQAVSRSFELTEAQSECTLRFSADSDNDYRKADIDASGTGAGALSAYTLIEEPDPEVMSVDCVSDEALPSFHLVVTYVPSGAAVFAGVEGSRPVLVEIQALAAPTAYGTPRRAIVGWDSARLAMILAVLETRCGLSFSGRDVYLSVAGGLRITEPAADLAVAAALISALADMPLPKQCVVFGEVALSGEVRPAGRTDLRLKEAAKLGFVAAFAPPQKKGGSGAVKVKQIGHIADLAAAIGVEADT